MPITCRKDSPLRLRRHCPPAKLFFTQRPLFSEVPLSSRTSQSGPACKEKFFFLLKSVHSKYGSASRSLPPPFNYPLTLRHAGVCIISFSPFSRLFFSLVPDFPKWGNISFLISSPILPRCSVSNCTLSASSYNLLLLRWSPSSIECNIYSASRSASSFHSFSVMSATLRSRLL